MGDVNRITDKKAFSQEYQLHEFNDDDYLVSEKINWSFLVTNQIYQITKIINTIGRKNPEILRDSIDTLYCFILKDGDQSQSFQQKMQSLQTWKQQQLQGLPPQQKAAKEASIEFEYSMKKFRIIMRLMDEKGYYGIKMI